jgi:cation transport protein ChaC
MLALTAELVDRFHPPSRRPEAPAAPPADMTAADYDDLADDLLADVPAGDPLFVFAYGSLLWRPVFRSESEVPAVAAGWHRAFRLKLTGWRGTPEKPGLMMVLDRGGSCSGVALAVPRPDRKAGLVALLKREMCGKAGCNQPRWIRIRVGSRPARAIAFCADRSSCDYAGFLSEAEVVDTLSLAVGHAGSCAEYLHKTVVALGERGIRDGNLWRLQARVAATIEARLAQGE